LNWKNSYQTVYGLHSVPVFRKVNKNNDQLKKKKKRPGIRISLRSGVKYKRLNNIVSGCKCVGKTVQKRKEITQESKKQGW
jgi:hypothetical protein